MRIHTLLRSTAIATLLGAAFFCSAVSAAEIKIAIVDDRLFNDAKVAKDIRGQLTEKMNTLKEDGKSKEKDLMKEQEEISKQKAVISKEAFEQKAKDFQGKFIETRKLFDAREQGLKIAEKKATQRVIEEVQKIIAVIAKEKGYTLALPKSVALYNEESADISKEVLAKLDEALPTLKLEIPDATTVAAEKSEKPAKKKK